MATVLISFIGTGRKANLSDEKSRSGYQRGAYQFEQENEINPETITTTVFGSALLKRLNNINRPVAKWLILGTQKSIWGDLIEAFDSNQQENLLEVWEEVCNCVTMSDKIPITQEMLSKWEKKLTAEIEKTTILCRLIGEMESEDSQQKAFKAILEAVENGDEVVFDITHGLRHQPVLASFMLMPLRWIRELKRIDLYYGAYELRTSNHLPSPVLKLSLANKMLESTEAVAIFEQTGNYRKLGDVLDLSPITNEHLEKLFFGDEMHKTKSGAAQNVKKEIKEKEKDFNQLELELAKKLESSLEWESEINLSKRWKTKALFEFNRQQYFKAVAWLWEAILIAACEKFSIADPLKYESREIAENKIKDKLDRTQSDIFWKLKNLRNSILHGSESKNNEVRKATESISEFSKVFTNGIYLFDEINKLK